MQKRHLSHFFWTIFIGTWTVVACTSCGSKEASTSISNEYAQGFSIEEQTDGIRLRIYDPKNRNKVEELFVANEVSLPRIATTSATHVGFLHALQATDCLAGACDPQYIYNEVTAADLGSSLELNPERIYASGANLLILSYSTNEKNTKILESLGVRCIYCNEWTEQHPLARAEWIRFFGALTGRLHEADSIFAAVKEAYYAERQESGNTDTPQQYSIMSGSSWQGTWYVPTGKTYMGRLFNDAGFSYAYAADSAAESIPLSFEQALLAFKDADVWVGAPGKTLNELTSYDEKHAWFKAYQNGRVYHFDRRTRGMANDFWETGVVRPDLILRDLRLIREGAADSLLFFADRLR